MATQPSAPAAVRCNVKLEHIDEVYDAWYLVPVETLSEISRYFNDYFMRYHEPTRRVKKICYITPYYPLDTVHNNWKLSYDIKYLETDRDVQDMFQWRTNTGDPLYLHVATELIDW
ncbi:hypothetical protein MtrunA17_Chr2g0312241 [Medicago truncatula]|uniref:Uncharacterized protein n=1 Tax=Medicago truncatula TaxID=3880 RepID=A0A396J910_MEDTR|nr:uncharacterized protein LOC120578077 [Medicago truncatula]RHN74610.1 hypothetical protein MtrunA17_Chr2g0312241 [Medicago truncatula]